MGRLRSTGVVAAAAVFVSGVAMVQADAESSDPTPIEATVEPALEAELDSQGAADFWIRFDADADLTSAGQIADWTERGWAVARALQATAEQSQDQVRQRLDDTDVDYDPFWATNAIYVHDGSAELAAELMAEPGVASLHTPQQYDQPDPVPEPAEDAVTTNAEAAEWGIANINADEVWSQYGITGTDIVVANIDSGVQFDHPALVRQYRGTNGDGTFTHDYNWFDASDTCAGVPCDLYGHGTHTMGTMAGDDGMGNQIGVAPGVKWIAANGCETCTDVDLIESAQWILLPTDLAGENPDAAMRPHIVNNSWGSEIPSTDPFMQDITDAWAASGIFGVWSNGNNGPTCDTSGSPGSRSSNFSVGAYDSSNAIASFSSRGVGQDGEIKPNLSAPGVAVRSSIPGNVYTASKGTSMAAPHAAGAIALLWSAAPGLIGDIDTTWDLLDGSATDSPDLECGGTADDNNVYGEGRLDALALVDAAPVQATGTLRISATDARTGDPVNGARISLTGPVTRERVTGADGIYSVALPVGDYEVSASAFGYADLEAAATVSEEQTTTLELEMRATQHVRLTGSVTDGSGQGWPLYAKVTLPGVPGGTTYTDPRDGTYAFSVPAEAAYEVTVTPEYAGYQTMMSDVAVGTDDLRHDIETPAVLEPCRTTGYAYTYGGVGTDFDRGLPDGWTVSDNNGSGVTWQFGDEFRNGAGERIVSQSGGAGGFAIGLSPGRRVYIDTTLTTPVADLSDVDDPVIGFRQHFTRASEDAKVELSLDGGATWETVLDQERSVRGPNETTVPIPQAANQSQVQVRFHYGPSRFNSVMWQLDDVYVGQRTCEPVSGGLVVGHVRDANTGAAVTGATVADARDAWHATESMATPLDSELGDGFYALFVPGTKRARVTASAHEYASKTKTTRLDPGQADERIFSLRAGRLRIKDDEVSEDVRVGHSDRQTVTLKNTGTAPMTVELGEGAAPPEGVEVSGQGNADSVPEIRVEGDFSPLSFTTDSVTATGADVAKDIEAPESPWAELGDYPTRIADNAVGEHDGKVYSAGGYDGRSYTSDAYVYDPGAATWSPIESLPEGRAAGAGTFIGDKFYVAGGWSALDGRSSTSLYIYDPQTDTWDTGAAAPAGRAGAGRAVLDGKLYLVGGCTNRCDNDNVQRYDPATDTWEILADYPEGRAHLACGALDGQIYCAGGLGNTSTQTTNSTYAYDPATDTWTQKASLPADMWGMAYTDSYGRLLVSGGIVDRAVTNLGWIYDPQSDSWAPLPNSRYALYRGGNTCGLYRMGGSIGGNAAANFTQMLPTYGACGTEDASWLSLNRTEISLAPGRSVKVTISLDAADVQPGAHDAGVWIKEDTPYLVEPIRVAMQVTKR